MIEIVNNNYFSSKTKLKEYTKNLIKEIGWRKLTEDQHNFFIELFKRHYWWCNHIEKIDHFYCMSSSNSIVIVKKDGEIDYPSYIKACMKTDPSKTIRNDLCKSFRNCINDEIKLFRKTTKQAYECELCKSNENLDVDHIYEFNKIVNDFLKIHQNHPTEFHRDRGAFFLEKDFEYSKLFQEYHKNIPNNLRYLCKKCNCHRNKIRGMMGWKK